MDTNTKTLIDEVLFFFFFFYRNVKQALSQTFEFNCHFEDNIFALYG